MGIIRRSFDFLSVVLFLQLYKSLVHPVLKYCQSIWQLPHKIFCKETEDVQCCAMKLIPSMKDKEDPDRLAALKQTTKSRTPTEMKGYDRPLQVPTWYS